MSRTLSMRESGTCSSRPAHQVGVGIDHDDGVPVPALGLLPHLVGDDVVHEGGLAHAGAGHVEVVPPEEVVGEVDLPGRAGGGVADVGAAPDAAGRGQHRRVGGRWGAPGSRRSAPPRRPAGGRAAFVEAGEAAAAGPGDRDRGAGPRTTSRSTARRGRWWRSGGRCGPATRTRGGACRGWWPRSGS